MWRVIFFTFNTINLSFLNLILLTRDASNGMTKLLLQSHFVSSLMHNFWGVVFAPSTPTRDASNGMIK